MVLNLDYIFDPDRPPGAAAPAPPDAAGPPNYITVDELPAEWHYLWDERAAIMEYDGNLPRERAEALALADIRAWMSDVNGTRRTRRGGPS